MSDTNRIVKHVQIKAPVERVWRAVTESGEFGEWFRVRLDGPFAEGRTVRGNILHPGYQHLVMEVVVKAIEPMRRFAYTWHPYAVDAAVDYSKEPPTLVEFTFEAVAGGTRLTVTESGFDRLPAHRRAEAFRMNEGGWAIQMKNVEEYVNNNP